MKVEIVSVGTELLMGQIANTDAQYIASRLGEVGMDSFFQQTVGDNQARLLQTIDLAASRSDIVVLTGGLGPTPDDLTKETLAKYLDLPLREDPASRQAMEAWMCGRGRQITPNNYKQVAFPQGAQIFPNERGTAPGFALEKDGKRFVVLPGPPNELTHMVDRSLMPYLQGLTGEKIVSRTLKFFGIGESALAYALDELLQGQDRVTVAPYAGLGEVSLRLSVKLLEGEEAAPLLDPVEQKIRDVAGQYLYEAGKRSLPEVVGGLLLEKGCTLALAESCTGGMIASELVALPGISAALLEGVVCYSNQAKRHRLGVSEETLRQQGAVSRACALEMAQGERRASGADYALSVTGIAGPDGGTEQKPVGLVYVGLAGPEGSAVRELRLGGDRQRIRRLSMLNALDLLRRALLGQALQDA